MDKKNCTNKKSLVKQIFSVLGYIFLILILTVGTGCVIYEAYLRHKLNKGIISASEKEYLDKQREMARLYWDN